MMDFIRTLRAQWRLTRIQAARARLNRLLEITPRHWRSAIIGGGVADLGCVTLKGAQQGVRASGGEIVHIDLDQAVITLHGEPQAAGGDS